jgi:hypothetical protein
LRPSVIARLSDERCDSAGFHVQDGDVRSGRGVDQGIGDVVKGDFPAVGRPGETSDGESGARGQALGLGSLARVDVYEPEMSHPVFGVLDLELAVLFFAALGFLALGLGRAESDLLG